MEKKNKRFLAIIAFCFIILLGSVPSLYALHQIKSVKANDDENYTLSITKFNYENNKTYTTLDDANYSKLCGISNNTASLVTPIQELQDGENVFVLRNASNQTANGNEECINVSFIPKSQSISFAYLTVSAKLNGKPIDTKQKLSETYGEPYCEFFDLKDTSYLDGTIISEYEAQGKYEFIFEYSIRDENGDVLQTQQKNVEFWLLSENFFINPNSSSDIKDRDNVEYVTGNTQNAHYININVDNQITYNKIYKANQNWNDINTEPRLIHTERIDRQWDTINTNKTEYNYFNYSNKKTTDYNGSSDELESQNDILYPTLVYDASRYNVSWTKVMYGVTVKATTKFTLENNQGYVIVTLTSDNNTTTKKYLTTPKQTQYIAEIPFDEIGTYKFTFNFALLINDENQTSQVVFNEENNSYLKKENWDLLGTDSLSIFGYQLYYSNYQNESSAENLELKGQINGENIHSDITNYYNSQLSEGKTISDLPLGKISIPSTNQAPLLFKYLASQKMKSDSTINTTSFYYLDNEEKNQTGNAGTIVDGITSNIRFTKNGTYKVYMEYTFPDYKSLKTNGITLENGTHINVVNLNAQSSASTHYQVFAFKISNIQPTLEFKKLVELTTENSTDVVYIYNSKTKTYERTNYNSDAKDITYYVESDFDANGYTNCPVLIDWEKALKSPFDVKPLIRISYQDATGKNENINQISLLSNNLYYVVNTNENTASLFTIDVAFGPCTYNQSTHTYDYSASVIFKFTIDRQPINNIEFSKSITNDDSDFEKFDTMYTNKDFIIHYGTTNTDNEYTNKKASGANINVTYSFIPLSQSSNVSRKFDSSTNTSYITNGATLKEDVKGTSLSYNQKDASNILSADGLYIFSFIDQAGNQSSRYILKDTTAPVAFQAEVNPQSQDSVPTWSQVPTDGSNNIFTKENNKVLIDCGNYKAIYFKPSNFNSDITAFEQEKPNSVKKFTDDGQNEIFIVIEITEQTITIMGTGEKLSSTEIEESSEKVYNVSATDACGNTISNAYVEINFDKSLFMAYMTGLPGNNSQEISKNGNQYSSYGNNNSSTRLYTQDGINISNKQSLYFTWKNGEDYYEIKDLTYDFYPFEFSNNTYTIASKPTLVNVNLLNLISSSQNGSVTSSQINLTADNRYENSLSTVQGKYVVKRTYKGFEDTSLNGDDLEREYTFFIDRNNIIQLTDNLVTETSSYYYIGNQISIILNKGNNKKTISSETLLNINSIQEYVFETNILPVSLKIPEYKYTWTYSQENGETQVKNLNALHYLIYKNNYTEACSNSDSEKIVDGFYKSSLTENGIYTIVIYDSTSEKKEYSNILTFKIYINLSAPSAYFVDEGTQLNLIDNPSVNKEYLENNHHVLLQWVKDAGPYKAEIDTENIRINRVTLNGTTISSETIYNVNGWTKNYQNLKITLIHSSNNNNYIDISEIENAINKRVSCRYDITLSYKGDSSYFPNNTFSIEKSIYFDYDLPTYNYTTLLNEDQYLSTEEKAEFYTTTATKNFENYAFTVDKDFGISLPSADKTFWQAKTQSSINTNDIIKAWYRQYDKYDEKQDSNTVQSIVPSDPRFSDQTQSPQSYRFNSDLSINNQRVYTQIRQSQFGKSLGLNINNYYEIIEMDSAGNYRIYSVYVYSTEDSALINYLDGIEYEKTEDENTYLKDEQGYNISNSDLAQSKQIKINNSSESINSKGIQLLSLYNFGKFINITIQCSSQSTSTTLYYYGGCSKPDNSENIYTDMAEFIKGINKLIEPTNVGDFFNISFRTSTLGTINVVYNTPNKNGPAINFSKDQNENLTVAIPQSQAVSTYITELKVYTADLNNGFDGAPTVYNYEEIKTLANNTLHYSYNNKGQSLKFVWTDNFNITYTKIVMLGVQDTPVETMIQSTDSTKSPSDPIISDVTNNSKTLTCYIANSFNVVYQPLIYNNFSIMYLNDDKWETLDISPQSTNINGTMKLIVNCVENDTHDTIYKIEFKDSAENKYTYIVHYYTGLAELGFKDNNGNFHVFDSSDSNWEENVSLPTHLVFNKNEYAEYETYVDVTLSYQTDNNQTATTSSTKVNEYLFNKAGKYTITAYNSLGNKKIYTFTKFESSTSYYSVIAQVDGTNIVLSPADDQIDYNNMKIDAYYSIYDATIDVDQTKLSFTKVGEIGEDTLVYEIKSIIENATYDNFIAIIKVNSTSNLLNGEFYIGNSENIDDGLEDVSGILSYTSNYKNTAISIPLYYGNTGNKLKVHATFDGKDIGYIKDYELSTDKKSIIITLKDSGVYVFSVTDLAGNTHIFGRSTNYFTLYILNDITYRLNGERGVYNSVFNSAVTLSLQNIKQFGTGTNPISISAEKNGYDYEFTNSSGNYIFSDYGTYYVTLIGYINGIVTEDDSNKVTTIAKFSIINENEAKLMHEYIGLNGYEVTNISKDGIDVTNEIKTAIGTSSINQFAIAGGRDSIGGNGHYTITVNVYYDDIIGSQSFSYNIWINNDTEALILCSIKEGESTTNSIKIKLNLYQIYSKLGDCKVKLNGKDFITINSSTASVNDVSTYSLNNNQRYNVTLETYSGNTILSFVVTKKEPLNSVAIIVIVIVTVVITGLTVAFIILRKRMKIR